MPNLLMALQQTIVQVSPYFNHRISMDTKGPTTPSSGEFSNIYFIVDAFSHYVLLQSSSRNDAISALNVLFDLWIAKIGTPDILATQHGSETNKGDFKNFCRVYNVQFKSRTPHALYSNGPVENSNSQINMFLRNFRYTI